MVTRRSSRPLIPLKWLALKLTTRLLLTVPHVFVTFLFLRLNLSDNGCSGLIEFFYNSFLSILLVIVIPLAFITAFRKRQSNNGKAEPFTLTIAILTTAILLIGIIFGDDLKGNKWIIAESADNRLHRKILLLRKNGTYRVDNREVDFTCFYSGTFKQIGDTIVLNRLLYDQLSNFTQEKYLLSTKYLISLDTVQTPRNRYDTLEIKTHVKTNSE